MLLESVTQPVHPALAPYVSAMVGYRHEGLAPGVHRGLPSPYLTIVVTIDEPLRLSGPAAPDDPPAAFDALVGGLHTRPVFINHPGRQCGVQLSLTPLGSRALMGLTAAAVVSATHLSDVLGADADEITERVRGAADWAGRFRAIEAVLLRRCDPDAALPPAVAGAWDLTGITHGSLSVEDAARRVGWSPRHLE